jgi:acyl dehydratase
MTSNAEAAFEILSAQKGAEEGVGEWFEVTQDQINAFADCTLDHQFIHIDPERAAKETPFGGTIAHGMLTLSMLIHLDASIPREVPAISGVVMGINYGFDRVRFLTPVNSGKRIRASSVVADVVLKGNNIDQTRTLTVELEGADKPAMVADWITRIVFA